MNMRRVFCSLSGLYFFLLATTTNAQLSIDIGGGGGGGVIYGDIVEHDDLLNHGLGVNFSLQVWLYFNDYNGIRVKAAHQSYNIDGNILDRVGNGYLRNLGGAKGRFPDDDERTTNARRVQSYRGNRPLSAQLLLIEYVHNFRYFNAHKEQFQYSPYIGIGAGVASHRASASGASSGISFVLPFSLGTKLKAWRGTYFTPEVSYAHVFSDDLDGISNPYSLSESGASFLKGDGVFSISLAFNIVIRHRIFYCINRIPNFKL